MKPKTIHYLRTGTSSTAPCGKKNYDEPMPKFDTDISKVNCKECLRIINSVKNFSTHRGKISKLPKTIENPNHKNTAAYLSIRNGIRTGKLLEIGVKRYIGGHEGWRAYFRIGVQTFYLSPLPTKTEAYWYAKNLRAAFATFESEVKKDIIAIANKRVAGVVLKIGSAMLKAKRK